VKGISLSAHVLIVKLIVINTYPSISFMQSEEFIKKIIIEVLFNSQADKLPVHWQDKVHKASREIYIRVLQPLKMINSLLLDSEEKLKKENLDLQHENCRLLTLVEKLDSGQSSNSKKDNQ
jgi:hypothetical protein